MSELILTGLDGKNPLAFFAALGVLNVLADRAKSGHSEPRLMWRAAGTYQPVIVGGPDREALIDVITQDLASFRDEAAIEKLRYRKDGGKGSEAHDLKPPPDHFVAYLRDLIASKSRRSLDFAAAFATDVATDNNGNTKPTALHFTAGQQEFLAMVRELIDGLRPEDFEEALFGPWRYERLLPVLRWDTAAVRDYAFRAGDPSKEKAPGIPGAEWLAFRGLPFFPVAPEGRNVVTTGASGGWKGSSFRWPMWTVPLPRSVVRSLLTCSELFELESAVLRARGIAMVFQSGIRRAENGGRGNFTPAGVAKRRDD